MKIRESICGKIGAVLLCTPDYHQSSQFSFFSRSSSVSPRDARRSWSLPELLQMARCISVIPMTDMAPDWSAPIRTRSFHSWYTFLPPNMISILSGRSPLMRKPVPVSREMHPLYLPCRTELFPRFRKPMGISPLLMGL